MAKKGPKGLKAAVENTPIVPPKILPKKKKTKAKPWYLPSLPVLLLVAVLGHIAYLLLVGGGDNSEGGDGTAAVGKPDHALAAKLMSQGMELVNSNHLLEGLELLEKAIDASPNIPHVYNAKAGVLRMLGRSHEALETLLLADDRVTKAYGPEHRELYLIKQGLFFVYKDLNQNLKAAESVKMAAALNPSADTYVNWASLEGVVGDVEKNELYSKALEIDPDNILAFCLRYHNHALLGEWDKLKKEHNQVVNYMNQVMTSDKRTDSSCMQPYHLSYLDFTAEMMRDTAKLFARREAAAAEGDVLTPLLPSQVEPQFNADGKRSRKLRIGYVSSDLQNHPVGRNVLGLMLAHNKAKFEIFCFSTKHVEGDSVTTTIMNTVNYVDISKSTLSHTAMAKMIREEYKIDVLVDLNGWTAGRRLQIFSANPAPVQMTHGLGFVGSTGVDSFQYFLSDNVASPARFDDMYTENVVRLPVAYLPASHKTVHITPEGASYDPRTTDKMEVRKENSLPVDDDIFVYCSFQSIHKISSEAFDSWMRILQNSPNSVLWLTSISDVNKPKLLKWAMDKHHVGPNRFVFSGSANVGEHLIRAQACDIHLDSWPYNAHSTATDVLWAGVPILVYLPDYHDPAASVQVPKMCSRVSASLLHTLGMPQLIVSTIEQFEDEAVRLSNDRAAYEAIRNELLEKRNTSKLYDLISYARHHEMAYSELFERFLKGQEPSSLDVPLIA
jgi:protein O-GlcNAc transferase